jgi:uncharacterized repeat protein (TIGR03803 family)
VRDNSGNLFGTTESGGANGYGTVFEWVKSTSTISVLANFNGSNGSYPVGGLVEDANGNLFGTTDGGYGSVFEWVRSTGAISVLATFDGANGANPYAGLVEDTDGNLFGTTVQGGTNGYGTLFEWVQTTGTMSVLANFDGTDGSAPEGTLVEDANGNLFGAAVGGGTNNNGTLFEWVKSSATLSVLAKLNSTDGTSPYGQLVEDRAGNLFGTTRSGGTNNDGTVFEWEKVRGAVSVLYNFSASGDGANPLGGLVEDGSGNLLGTTSGELADTHGTVFEWVKSTGKVSTLAVFNGSNGTDPEAGLVEDGSGELFGTTNTGGTNNDGTVFELDTMPPVPVVTFGGFLPALKQQKTFDVGDTIPIKFQLFDANDQQVTSLAAVPSIQIRALDKSDNPVGQPLSPATSKGLVYGRTGDTGDADRDDHFTLD